jgi:hypothetical protein
MGPLARIPLSDFTSADPARVSVSDRTLAGFFVRGSVEC